MAPEAKVFALNNCNPVFCASLAKNGIPTPKITGFRVSWYSSTKPSCASVWVRLGLPKITMSLPGCCLSFVISSARLPAIMLVLFQSTVLRVVETTTLGIASKSP